VDVPTELEARARQLLADLEYVGASEQDPEPPTPTNLRRPMLAGVAFLVPGCGHFYARRAWTGLVMATGIVCTYYAAMGSGARGGRSEGEFGFAVFIALFLCDAIGGVLACRAENRDVPRPGQSDQILRGLVLIAIALGAGAGFAGVASIPGRLLTCRLARFHVMATPSTLTVRNDDRDGRVVAISGVNVRVGATTRGRIYRVRGEGSLTVEAGQQATLRIDVDAIADLCAGSPSAGRTLRPEGEIEPSAEDVCTIVFDLDATLSKDGWMLEGQGTCWLIWSGGGAGAACEIVPRHAGSRPRGE